MAKRTPEEIAERRRLVMLKMGEFFRIEREAILGEPPARVDTIREAEYRRKTEGWVGNLRRAGIIIRISADGAWYWEKWTPEPVSIDASCVDTVDATRFVTGASDAGLQLGLWPAAIQMDDKTFERGPAFLGGGEFAGYRYFTADGRFMLTIYND